MTPLQAIVTILVALIGIASGTTTALLAHKQFKIKRQDEKEANSVKKQIDDAIAEAKKEMQEKIDTVSVARSLEGKDRFDTHAAAIKEINEQIKANNEQIGELAVMTKAQMSKMDAFAESLTVLNKMARMSAESQRNSTYDRILVVANKALKNQQITITEKTNLKQLYDTWTGFHGKDEKLDPKIVTIYEECMKLTPVPDEK